MAIQIIPAAQKKLTFMQSLAIGAGKGLEEGIKLYGEHQKKKAEEQEYQEENETYKQLTGRNLSKNPRIREMEIQYALKGQSEFQKEERKYKSKSEEAAAKLAGEKETQKQLNSFADRLETNNPNSPVHKTIADIYRTELPMDQKSAIVKSLTGVDPFKVQQQQRLQLDSVLKRYNSRIKEIDDEIKGYKAPTTRDKAVVDDLRKQRMALRSERDQLLDFRALNGMDNEEEYGIEEASDLEDEEEEGPKVMFDPNNKKHQEVAKKLYKKFKDKEKVRQILRKNYKGI